MDRRGLLRLIGNVRYPEVRVKEVQTTDDIIKRIEKKHVACKGDYDKIALSFRGGDLREVCERIYDFCRKNISYYEEPVEDQYVSAPSTILRRGYSDCKGYALFSGGVLDALKRQGMPVDWWYRFTSYDLFNDTPGHVFIVVRDGPHEIWIDPVLSVFDRHKFYWHKKERPVNTISGIGCDCNRARGTLSGSPGKVGLGLYQAAPPDAVPVPLPYAYPKTLPYWVVTKDNKLKITPTPFGRKLTDPELKVVMDALQNILNRYTNYNQNVYTYVSKGGWTVAGDIRQTLNLKNGDFCLTCFSDNYFTAIPRNIDANNRSGLGPVGDVFKLIISATPLGLVTTVVNAVDRSNQISTQQQAAANLQNVKNANASPVLEAAGINPAAGGQLIATGDNKWIWIAAGVLVIYLATKD